MRLLLVSSEFPPGPGGIGTHAYHLAKHLANHGNKVMALTSQNYALSKEIAEFNRGQPFSIHTLKEIPIYPIKVTCYWIELTTAIKKFCPDVVVASGSRSVWMTAAALKNSSIPWIAMGHGSEFGDQGVIRNRLTIRAFSQANEIICVSKYTQMMMEKFGIKSKRVSVIHNGADEELYQFVDDFQITQIRKSLGLEGQFLLLTVGNVTPRKGQEVVIRALPAIIREIPQVQYVMAGLPTYQKQFYQLACQLGVQDHIKFLGRVDLDKLVQVYQVCDIFLMTSQHAAGGDFEGFGIAVIEAALCGKPSIVSSGSGLEEAVLDGVTGVVVPESDPNATAEAVIGLWKEPARLRSLGNSAHHYGLTRATWKNVAAAYNQNILELVSQTCGY